MHSRIVVMMLAVVAVLMVVPFAVAQTASFTPLGLGPNGVQSFAWDASANGAPADGATAQQDVHAAQPGDGHATVSVHGATESDSAMTAPDGGGLGAPVGDDDTTGKTTESPSRGSFRWALALAA